MNRLGWGMGGGQPICRRQEIRKAPLDSKEGKEKQHHKIITTSFSSQNPSRARGQLIVRYHCGGWLEEVNSCVLNSYMVYL
jgi:hypothetical protein